MEIIRRLELTFQYIQSFAYSFLLLGYLLFVPIQSQILNNIVTCLALVVICISFIKSRMVYKFIAISFLIIGVLLAVYDRKFNILFVSGRFVEGIHIVLPVLALFTIVPLFAYPVQAGSYHHSIAQIVYSVKKSKISSRFYYLLTIFTTYLLTIMMNIASIATTKNSLLGLQKTFDQNVQQHILMRALPRGFILATIWSPVSVVGITAVTGTGGDWLIYVQVAVVLSLILVLITALLGWKEVPFSAASMFVVVESEGDKRNDRSPQFDLIVLLCVFFLYILSALFLFHMYNLSLIYALTVMTIPFFLLWMIGLRQASASITKLKKFLNKDIVGKADQFCVFLPLGIFIYTLQETSFLQMIHNSLFWAQKSFNHFIFILILGIFPIFFAQVGIFPVLTIIFLTQIVDPGLVQLRPEWLALLVASCGSAGFISSPLNMIAKLTSELTNLSTLQVFKGNLLFVISMYITSCFVVFILQLLYPQ